MGQAPAPGHPDEWLHQHLVRIEKLLLVIALGQPNPPDQANPQGPYRSDILEEAFSEVYPGGRR
jgi:hypothetical protein